VKQENNDGGLIPGAFFACSPGVSTPMFRYYLLGGDTVASSWLYALPRFSSFYLLLLARSAKLPTGLYILPMFFFIFLFF